MLWKCVAVLHPLGTLAWSRGCVQTEAGQPATVVITGSKSAVDTAALLVNTQLQFNRRLASERERQQEVVKRLNAMDLQYGVKVLGTQRLAGWLGSSVVGVVVTS